MNKTGTGKFLCCLAAGAAAGAAIGIFHGVITQKQSGAMCSFRKKAAKVARKMGGIADALGYFLK